MRRSDRKSQHYGSFSEICNVPSSSALLQVPHAFGVDISCGDRAPTDIGRHHVAFMFDFAEVREGDGPIAVKL